MKTLPYKFFKDSLEVTVNGIFEFGGDLCVDCDERGSFVVIDKKEYIRMKEALGESED